MGKLPLSSDLEYLAIFSLVLILPKILVRFKLPTGITALTIGVLAGSLDPRLANDQLFRFLSQIGITSLFVFAGLEVEFEELKEDKSYLSKYLVKTLVILFTIASAFYYLLGFPFQEAFIYSLGIFTPSAGFIINSLHSFKISEDTEYWVKSKAISKEILAILLLFFALQGGNPKSLAISIVFYTALYFILPKVFRYFFKFISPYAPNSEVPFLVLLSLICGVISKELGAYYLVGAFAVGLIGSKFKNEIFKDNQETLFSSLSSFFNVFLPFYFFFAGLKIKLYELSFESLYFALGLLCIFVPLRIILIRTSITYILKDITQNTFKISMSLMPTLIFGLVIAGILKDRGIIRVNYIYALIIYTLLTSLLPTLFLSFRKTVIPDSLKNTEPSEDPS